MSGMTDGRRTDNRRSMLLWGIAALLFVLGVAMVWRITVPRRETAVEMVLMGDSLHALGRGEDAVADRLAEDLQVKVLNAALGGTSMARVDRERWMDHTMDNMSMISLSKAILAGDYSVQKQAGIKAPATEYFDEVVSELEKVDFGRVRILFLCYGMNDYQSGIPIEPQETIGNIGNEYSFTGALRRVLTDLKKEYPSLRIILVSPTFSWYLSNGRMCDEQDWGAGLLEQYVLSEQAVAAEYGVEFIDLYHGLYEHDTFEDWKKYTTDGVHPNETGKALMTDVIRSYLEEHP